MARKLNPVQAGLSYFGVFCFHVMGIVMRLLPPAAWGFLASMLSAPLWWLFGKYRKKTVENLISWGRTPAEARALGRACFRSNLLVFFESLAMPRLIARKGVRVTSNFSPAAEAAIEKVRTGQVPMALGVSGHTGVWEFLGAELARLCAPVPIVVSARVVKNPVMDEYLIRLRKTYNIHIIHKEEGLRYLQRELRRKSPSVYLYLCDQHFRGGLKVPFLGRSACTVAVPAKLIRKYDVPAFMGRCVRIKPGVYEIYADVLDREKFKDLPADEAEHAITAAYTAYIQESIEMAPEQWTWGHRRWRPCCEPEDAGAEA